MTKTIEAVYAGGVLRPLGALFLPEEQRVRLTIGTIDAGTYADREKAMQRLMDRLEHYYRAKQS